jgi:Cu+-exporting ATPase
MLDGMTDRAVAEIDLDVRGMTCASCAARVERRLNDIDGVHASVNLATESAHISFDPATHDTGALIEAVRTTGYDATVRHRPGARLDHSAAHGADGADESDHDHGGDPAALRQRLAVSAALALPVLVLGMADGSHFAGWRWVSLLLAAPVLWWGGWPFHRAAARALRHRATTMDTLVSLGTVAAFGWSVVGTITSGTVYFEVSAVVIVFLLAGRYLEALAKRRSGAALRALLELGAKQVTVLRDGVAVQIPTDDLEVGEQFLVRPGEKLATDGMVRDGRSSVDESLLTGESLPVDVEPGSAVTGGTINGAGPLRVEATRVGTQTRLAQITALVVAAQTGKAAAQRLADRISAVFVPTVLGLAVLTALGWLATGGTAAHAFTAAVAVLIIACPCALGLATPTALLVGTGRGAQLGVLIRGPQALEATRRITTVVLDKTGTVTTGRMSVRSVTAADGTDPSEVLRRAGALEAVSEHPIAVAIAARATEAGPVPAAVDVQAVAGAGIAGTVIDGGARERVVVGSASLLAQHGLSTGVELADAARSAAGAGATVVFVGWAGAAHGVVAVGDTVRPSSAEAVRRLRILGIRPMLLTGDNRVAATAVAAEVGIDPADVLAEVAPEDKAATVARLRDSGAAVAMVGDGINDAAALASADLGIAMGSGADVAIEAADVTLVRPDLLAAVDAIRLARRTLATIRGNLFWAFAYNVVLIPVAAAGLLAPMLAGGAMALSSLFVVTNSLRLRRFRGERATVTHS